MGSTHGLLTPTIIAREALRLLKNNLVMGNLVYRAYEAEFPGNPKKGGTVTIRKPVKFVVTKARTRATSTISELSITLTVSTQAHVSWEFNTADLTLSIEDYSERYIRPAAAILANTVDADLLDLYKYIYNAVWETSGQVTPHTFMVIGKAMQRLDEEAAPMDERVLVLNPAAHWSLANALSNLYTPEPATKALRKGYLGTLGNAEIYMDQNVKTHVVGSFHESSAWTSALSAGSSDAPRGLPTACSTGTLPSGTTAINICNLRGTVTTRALAIGDVFSINNVYAVNPMSGESTGSLRQFVVTADASIIGTDTGSANNIITVHFDPIMRDTGPYKTISTVPAAGAQVFIWPEPGASIPQNLAFHKNAFALCMVPLEKPDGVSFASTVTEDGYSIRVVKDYDIDKDDEVIRLDILYGVKTLYPELAVRIMGESQGGVKNG